MCKVSLSRRISFTLSQEHKSISSNAKTPVAKAVHNLGRDIVILPVAIVYDYKIIAGSLIFICVYLHIENKCTLKFYMYNSSDIIA